MPQYEFENCDNPKCPDNIAYPNYRHIYVMEFKMADVVRAGEKIPCPTCGKSKGKGKVTRIYSLTTVIVRQPEGLATVGNDFVTNLNGKETHIQFVDHPHTDADHDSAMIEAYKRQGVQGAYYNEKHGKVCVDVLSNVEDPLGKIKRSEGISKKSETRKVNQGVKIRRPTPGKRANTTLKPYIPVRNHG